MFEIGPPSNPLPVTILVTVPEVTALGSHCDDVLFHPRTWPPPGALVETLRACNFTALTLLIRLPSTAGYWPRLVTCKILLAAVPTSTLRVPEVEILPPVRPVPAETLVTDPPAPQPPAIDLQFKPALSQIVVTRIVPLTSKRAFGVIVPMPTFPVEVKVMRMALLVTTLRLV